MSDDSVATPLVQLDSPCRLAGRLLFLGRARMFPKWFLVTGWTPLGRYRRQVWHTQVASVRLLPGYGEQRSTLQVRLHNGPGLDLQLKQGTALWKMKLEAYAEGKEDGSLSLKTPHFPLRTLDQLATEPVPESVDSEDEV